MKKITRTEMLSISGGYCYTTLPNFAAYAKIFQWIYDNISSQFKAKN